MTRAEFITQLKRHEGFRDRVYRDTEGHLTGGWGHAFLEGSPLPLNVCEALFNYDVAMAVGGFASLDLGDIGPVRRYAFINMVFNMGLTKLMGFKDTLAAARARDWETAAKEMLDSKWARQVGRRAVELAEMVRTGKAPP